PSGHWAEQFSIIAWPITHAVLPRYLQWQFARALYEMRYQLAHLDTLSPVAIGQLLAANAWEASSRFRELLQQQELVGRIVLALMSERTLVGESPLYPPTLKRLVADLEGVQSSRERLKEARLLVAERMKGAARAAAAGGPRREAAEGDSGRVSWRLRPTLILRRSTNTTWSIVLDIPNFADAARSDPELQRLLRTARCKVAGSDTWLPGGWLITGSRRRVVKQWPGAGTPLVQFEGADPVLGLLVMETRLTGGPVWLCRLAADELGREVMSRVVRPGRTYILLSEPPILGRYDFLSACKVDCEGIQAVTLTVPEPVTFETMTRLQHLGLQVARTVRIFPAGLSARGFDGEGHSEWLTTEAPCFGILHDHPVDHYSLSLDAGPELHLSAPGPSTPVFVSIQPLPSGTHRLAVKAYSMEQCKPPVCAAEGVITLDVRDPEPWIPGTTSHVGLAITLAPDSPSLDDFWEGHTRLTVLGPAGHRAACELQLLSAGGKELLSETVATFDLPITSSDWAAALSSFTADDRRAWTFAEATSCQFLIKGDELGQFSLRLERYIRPLRWASRTLQKATTLRLIDDTGGDETPACRFSSLKTPAVPISLDVQAALSGFDVESPGGLFEACSGRFHDDVIVSIPIRGRGFADLLIEPDVSALETDTLPTAAILEALSRWSGARLMGPLVSLRRNRILERIANSLYARLCGERWAEAEAAYLSTGHAGFARQRLLDAVGVPHGLATVLSRESDRMEAGESGVAWFFSVVVRYQICSNQGLCEFALRLAGSPHDVLGIVPTRELLDALLSDVKEKSTLLRGARLVALLCASRNPGPYGGSFPRWTWRSSR
ncbi:MAG TPA: hypothetical protein VMK12_13500, partial [Anaeromyxobacteraceae bacterium]|nr:hypothetical protein [Anaeromyxobacteraceae bacterium]